MNAAARFANQGALSRGLAVSLFWTKDQFSTIFLTLMVLTSALSLVYVTNSSRSLNASLQQTLADREQLHVQWGQLLLEKGTWMTQGRVQRVAERDLNMVLPDGKSVVVVRTQQAL